MNTSKIDLTNPVIIAFQNSFKDAALWSSSEYDMIEDQGLTVHNCSDNFSKNLNTITVDFLKLLTVDQVNEFLNDPSDFGHNLALELQGHGSGFFDDTNPTIAAISEKLEQVNFWRFEGVYIGDVGETLTLELDLFNYGGKAYSSN
jgi:hypothetical protein